MDEDTENPVAEGTNGVDPLSASLIVATSPDQAATIALVDARLDHPRMAHRIIGVFAKLSEASPNWHSANIFFLVSENQQDQYMKKHMLLFTLVAYLMVLFQCLTAVAATAGAAVPSCMVSDQCFQKGMFCNAGLGRCSYCGSTVPLPLQTDAVGNTYNHFRDRNFAGYNVSAARDLCTTINSPSFRYHSDDVAVLGSAATGAEMSFSTGTVSAWCDACFFETTGDLDTLTFTILCQNNVAMMGPFDWASLIFASYVIGLSIAGELRDIEICAKALRDATGDHLSKAWHVTLLLKAGIRHWVFLPAFLLITPILVALRGGDALSVCMNTVALLFLSEVDTVSYELGLSERVKSRVEEAGRIELDETEAKMLTRTKAIHVAVVMICEYCKTTRLLTVFEF